MKRDRRLLVATDLDGTLLDERSYEWEPARPALAALAEAGALLVLASSKTRSEMEPLAAGLGFSSPLIVENGGAVLVPRPGGGYEALTLRRRPRSAARPASARRRPGGRWSGSSTSPSRSPTRERLPPSPRRRRDVASRWCTAGASST
jgi:hypothetical protein